MSDDHHPVLSCLITVAAAGVGAEEEDEADTSKGKKQNKKKKRKTPTRHIVEEGEVRVDVWGRGKYMGEVFIYLTFMLYPIYMKGSGSFYS